MRRHGAVRLGSSDVSTTVTWRSPTSSGNNRLDSYRNIVEHPYVGLLLMAPGRDETLRINGPAVLTTDDDLLAGFTKELRTPKMAIVVETAEVYGHCAKAFRRGHVWHPDEWGQFAEAPDLATMYACQWGVDEQVVRDDLEQSYEAGIAAD
ncbi:MAG: pyridoxamine 5'-phosphate oxidase family protein [Ilumatobacteraceae bacterium]